MEESIHYTLWSSVLCRCILNNVEYANSCPLCRAEVGIELPRSPVNILPSVNETRAVGGIGRNPRVVNPNRTMHLIEVDSVIDHLIHSTSTTLTHARHMVWNDVALLFNQVFTGGNQSIDRPTHEMLQRTLADIHDIETLVTLYKTLLPTILGHT